MATTEGTRVLARTGQEFLDGLRGDAREVWLDGEKITHPIERPELAAAAHSIARVFDLQHAHADEMLAPAPDHGGLVNVTHLIPRTPEDLRAPAPRDGADGVGDGRPDGPHAGLPQRHLRLLRRAPATCGPGAATSRARRTSSPTRRSCATATSRRRTAS